MKKLIAIFVVVAILASMSVSVSAATTTLSTTVPEATYTMNIPANQEITYGATTTSIGTVTITDAENFATGKNVYVKVEYDGTFKADGVSTTIPYSIKQQGEYKNTPYSKAVASGEYLTFLGVSSGVVNSYFYLTQDVFGSGIHYYNDNQCLNVLISSTDWGKALGGEYSTTITFTAQVSNELPTA